MIDPNDVPAWKQRAVEKSIRSAKLRAEQRVQKFLEAAQSIISERGTAEFTVQEVVDRSGQSLRSFYLQFDGKHSLLLALLEEELSRSADQIRTATSECTKPIDRLSVAVVTLFEIWRPDSAAGRPLFNEVQQQLIRAHPTEVKNAHAPLLFLLTEMFVSAAEVGDIRAGADPERTAAMVMHTVMSIAQSSAHMTDVTDVTDATDATDATEQSIGSEEVWQFCLRGFAGL